MSVYRQEFIRLGPWSWLAGLKEELKQGDKFTLGIELWNSLGGAVKYLSLRVKTPDTIVVTRESLDDSTLHPDQAKVLDVLREVSGAQINERGIGSWPWKETRYTCS